MVADRKFLIALDEPTVSRRAARAAVELFAAPGAEFLMVNVAKLPVTWGYPPAFGSVAPMPAERLESRGLAPEDVERLADDAGVVQPAVLVEEGDPVACSCAAAEAHDVAVVVVGSHDTRLVARLVDPSVAAGVARGAHRPVLVVSGEPA